MWDFKKIWQLVAGTSLQDEHQIVVSEGEGIGQTKRYSIAQVKQHVVDAVNLAIGAIAKGDKGDTGATGSQGVQGLQGVKGDKGERGVQGVKGDQGVPGPQGIQGANGLPGTVGLQGLSGIQGIQGIQGEQGVQGEQGIQGEQGEMIVAGEAVNLLNGIVPPTTEGVDNDFYIDTVARLLYGPKAGGVWPSGTIILTGAKGDTGDQGIQGEQGIQGVQGEQGLQGVAGEQGVQGIQGEQGIAGVKGDTGATGADGAPGVQGEKGDTGDVGADGLSAYEIAVNDGFIGDEAEWLLFLKGADGEAGADGLNGTDGADGSDGADGLSAYEVAVANGFVGTESEWLLTLVGADGADGAPGVDGSDGATGPAGADGATGATGATGPAGSDATVNATNVASVINGATAKTTPVDADTFGLIDSAASNALKKLSWANVKATLKTWIETSSTVFSLFTATKGLFGTTTSKNAHFVIGASTSTLANEHKDWGVAYTGSEAGAEWKETTGYRKYLKRNGVTDEYLFMGANPALAGTGVVIPLLAADGSWSRGPAVDEGFTLDSDIISAITGATYTTNYATITPASSKVFRQGDEYFDSSTKYLYKAVADNAVKRIQ